MPRYKDRSSQHMYEAMLKLAEDKTSEMYYNGAIHRGAFHRCAFWDGFSGLFTLTGPGRSPHVIPGTMSAACFMAGKEFARRQRSVRAGLAPPPRKSAVNPRLS